MKDIIFCILLVIAPILIFSLVADDDDLDNNKRPPAEHKPSSTICSPVQKERILKKESKLNDTII